MWMCDVVVGLFDLNREYSPGQIQEEEFTVPRTAAVKDVLNLLKGYGKYASLYKAGIELLEDDKIEDVFDEEDVLTAAPPPNERFDGKTVENCSDDHVILMDKKQRPIFVPKQNEHFLKMQLLDFSPILIVFRYLMVHRFFFSCSLPFKIF